MIQLTSIADAEALLAHPEPLWIFKHSNTCGTSYAANEEVTAFLAAQPMTTGIVVVQEARPVSNWLAERFATIHRSPQLFLVHNGKVIWQTSHGGITVAAMTAACRSL